jgi:hypothetical protein
LADEVVITTLLQPLLNKIRNVVSLKNPSHQVSMCDIGKITFHLMMAKYLPMSPKGETLQ